MGLVLSPNSGRSRHPRTPTHATAPQPTWKINKPPRAAAGAPGPSPAPPRGSHTAPSAGTSLPPSARGRVFPAPHRSLQPRSLQRSARPGAPGPVSAPCPLAGPPCDPRPARTRPCPPTLDPAQSQRPVRPPQEPRSGGGGGRRERRAVPAAGEAR